MLHGRACAALPCSITASCTTNISQERTGLYTSAESASATSAAHSEPYATGCQASRTLKSCPSAGSAEGHLHGQQRARGSTERSCGAGLLALCCGASWGCQCYIACLTAAYAAGRLKAADCTFWRCWQCKRAACCSLTHWAGMQAGKLLDSCILLGKRATVQHC